MKKVFLTIAMVAFAFAANAQFVISGQLGFNTTGGNTHHEALAPVTTAFDVPDDKSMNFTFAPSIGYMLNDNMQVGLSLMYSMLSTTVYNTWVYPNNESWNLDKQSMFGVAPYFRYYFAEAGNFNFFCQAEIAFVAMPRAYYHYYDNSPAPLGYDNEGDGAMSATMLSLSITPGVNYKFSDNWSADCFIDLAGLAFAHTTVKNYIGDDLANTDVTNDFGLIANTSAQTLNAHLGNFRIGFNFHF
ncbi:MAG: outer membrane beta-barrel protein [Bacteroidales bacterium]|nr:outer membrane beta-barrel protein [Bacteroidales bacterium]